MAALIGIAQIHAPGAAAVSGSGPYTLVAALPTPGLESTAAFSAPVVLVLVTPPLVHTASSSYGCPLACAFNELTLPAPLPLHQTQQEEADSAEPGSTTGTGGAQPGTAPNSTGGTSAGGQEAGTCSVETSPAKAAGGAQAPATPPDSGSTGGTTTPAEAEAQAGSASLAEPCSHVPAVGK